MDGKGLATNKFWRNLEPYIYMFIIALGLFGNTCQLVIFTFNKQKKPNASFYLAALACTDNLTLLGLLLMNIKHFGVNWHDTLDLVCKLNNYLSYIFPLLSTM